MKRSSGKPCCECWGWGRTGRSPFVVAWFCSTLYDITEWKLRHKSNIYKHIQTNTHQPDTLQSVCKQTHRTTSMAGTVHEHRQPESFRGAHTFVCLVSLCFWCGWCGWWLGLSGRRSSFYWRNGTNGRSGRGWFETGQRCGQTASGRRSGLRAPTQMHMADWLWHT